MFSADPGNEAPTLERGAGNPSEVFHELIHLCTGEFKPERPVHTRVSVPPGSLVHKRSEGANGCLPVLCVPLAGTLSTRL